MLTLTLIVVRVDTLTRVVVSVVKDEAVVVEIGIETVL